ncbi:response regulator [Thermodesulfobacteriota bacterium]
MGRRKKILLIDDQQYLQELLSEELSSSRYEIDTISDINTLEDFFRTSTPDIVLLDLYLNGFEGWDILRDLKNKHPHLPVLIVTAYDNYMDDSRLTLADGYVVKNSNLTALKQKIENII